MTSQPPKKCLFTTADEKAICQILSRRVGIVVQPHQLPELKNYLETSCSAFGYYDAAEYITALQHMLNRSKAFEDLVSMITVNESYFFRDRGQMQFLRNQYLPTLINEKRKNGHKTLRIWSSGCAGGQELYSVAMLLYDLLPDIDTWSLHLLGSDINTSALAKAIAGCYGVWSFRATNDAIRKRFFEPIDQKNAKIIADIRQLVTFTYLNLIEDVYPSVETQTSALDLILCRNVFIYFDTGIVEKIMQRFVKALLPGGVLLLGASDFIQHPPHALAQTHYQGMTYYRHIDATLPQIRSTTDVPSKTSKKRPIIHKNTVIESTKSKKMFNKFTDTIEEDDPKVVLGLLMEQARWQDVLEKIQAIVSQKGEDAVLLQWKAEALANLGQLQAARAACEKSLQLNSLDPHTYFLKGIILLNLNENALAVRAFRQTLFLDPYFIEADYQLGLVLIRQGKQDNGVNVMKLALRKLKKMPRERLADETSHTYDALAESLMREITIHEEGP